MRRLLAALCGLALLGLAVPATAADAPKAPALSDLQPPPEPPPPPPGLQTDEAPQVTITKRGEDQAEEYRVNGKLYMIKVTPPHGVPYFLIDSRGDGVFSRMESTDSGLRVPMWVIKRF